MEHLCSPKSSQQRPDFFCYVLRDLDGRHYTGITSNLMQRMKDHFYKKSKSTRHMNSLFLVCFFAHKSRADARLQEVSIKSSGAARYLSRHTSCNDHLNISLKSLFS